MFYFISCLGHGDPQVNRTVAKTTVFLFSSSALPQFGGAFIWAYYPLASYQKVQEL